MIDSYVSSGLHWKVMLLYQDVSNMIEFQASPVEHLNNVINAVKNP